MRRALPFLPLSFFVAGCVAYCDGGPFLKKAATGDLEAIHECGELGRPLPPCCADTLPQMNDAFEALEPLLASRDREVRVAAVEGLRTLCDRAPDLYRNRHRGLFDRALSDPWREVRWRAAWALGRIRETTEALRGTVRDPDALVAVSALEALGRATDEAALGVMARALDRPEEEVRKAALAALERVSGKTFPDAASWRRYAEERARARDGVAPVDTGR